MRAIIRVAPSAASLPSIALAWPQKFAYARSPMPSTAYRMPASVGASAPSSRSQKQAPLSGGPPSPKVLVTTSTSRAAANSVSCMSSMLTSWESSSLPASRVANSSALPVCDAHNTNGPALVGRLPAVVATRE